MPRNLEENSKKYSLMANKMNKLNEINNKYRKPLMIRFL